MSELLTRGGGENVPGILGACAPRNFAYLARGPLAGPMQRMILGHYVVYFRSSQHHMSHLYFDKIKICIEFYLGRV